MVADPSGGGRSNTRRRIEEELSLSRLKDPDAIPPANRAERRARDKRDKQHAAALRHRITEVIQKKAVRAWRKQRRLARLTG